MIKDEKKQIGDLTNKLDELLDWLVRSPISDKDFDTIHKIYEKYVKKEEKWKIGVLEYLTLNFI